MGGVCTGGTARNRVEIHHESPPGSSKKGNSVESIGKQKKAESFSYPDVGAFRGTPNLYDSGELYMSISRELKPSTPARTGVNKVLIFMETLIFVDVFGCLFYSISKLIWLFLFCVSLMLSTLARLIIKLPTFSLIIHEGENFPFKN